MQGPEGAPDNGKEDDHRDEGKEYAYLGCSAFASVGIFGRPPHHADRQREDGQKPIRNAASHLPLARLRLCLVLDNS